MDASRLATLMSSRVCHDLIKPLGPILNGLDLLEDSSAADVRAEAMALVQSGAKKMRATLRYMRAAYGASGAGAGDCSLDEAKELVEEFLPLQKIAVDWRAPAVEAPRPAVRLTLNLALTAVDCVLRNGRLEIDAQPAADGVNIVLALTGDKLHLKEAVMAGLRGEAPGEPGSKDDAPAESIRIAQPYFTSVLIQELGGKLHARESKEKIEFIAFIPGGKIVGQSRSAA